MDYRSGYATQRQPPPQRSVSTSYALHHALRRNPLPSRLQSVRSVSHADHTVHLTSHAAKTGVRNAAAFLTNSDTVYTSPDVINIDDDDDDDDDEIDDRPTKRAKTNSAPTREEARADSPPGHAHQIVPGSPLPPLRKPNNATNKSVPQRSRRAVVDRLARRAKWTDKLDDGGGRPQWTLEPPELATRQPQQKDKEGNVVKDKKGKDVPRRVLDFAPWHGYHPEDILNENVVKTGYYDKAPGVNSTESNSAKPTIWPNLSQKNNMGLQTLSYLFSSVMEKRQQQGKVGAHSTFKPPPRITVPDTKRETWLRDLANTEAPLRQRSRAIPHGIKGKPLMEQCLAKSVPIPRAVWLAKCVGANEMRQFRRKGVSGPAAASKESQWIREWTVNIEQFLDGVISVCGQPEWQSRMDYAVKMVTSFYAERILEQSHYLDWIVSSFARASMERLPIWIILVQLYWKDITAFGRRGRQLAEAILEKLHQITTANRGPKDILGDRLRKLIVVMSVTNRGCLVLPRTWQKYRHLLASRTVPETSPVMDSPAQNIAKRNARIAGPLNRTPKNTRCAMLTLYAILDKVGLDMDIEKLTKHCMTTVDEVYKLVAALLHWSGSVYRTATHRVYLSAQIIIQLSSGGHDTDGVILDFLRSAKISALVPQDVYRVISELVRAQCFSTGRFMQWLITGDVLFGSSNSDFAAGLLAALPLDVLPTHLLNTRHMLMRRLGLKHDERAAVSRLTAEVDQVITMASPPDDLSSGIESFSGSAKLQLASNVAASATASAKSNGLSLHCFCTIRSLLQRCGDMTALADVSHAAIYTDDTALLATISDTANTYAMTFASLGHLLSMHELLSERYRTLRSQQPLDKIFVLALTSLTRRVPGTAGFVKLLENDLTICEQQSSLAVCSPASDNLINMQASNFDSDADIDAVFASGNMMDEQLMQRVFGRIVKRESTLGCSDAQHPSKICNWLSQLRAADTGAFEQLVQNYVRACLKSAGDSIMHARVLSALVAAGCFSLEAIADIALETKTTVAACITIRLIVSGELSHDSLHAAEAFRFRVLQERFIADCAAKVIPLAAAATEDANCPVDDPGMMKLVLDCATNSYELAVGALAAASLSQTFLGNCLRITKNIFNLAHSTASSSIQLDAKSVIALADPLSIVHCSAMLTVFSKIGMFKSGDGNTALQEAMLDVIKSGSEIWPQLLESVGQDTISGIYQWAKEQVMDNALRSDDPASMDHQSLQKTLGILDVAHHAAKDPNSAPVIIGTTEKLRSLDGQLSAMNASGSQDCAPVLASLDVLLHLAVLYGASPERGNDSLQQTRCSLLAALCSLLVNARLQMHQDTLEHIHDVASAIADTLPEIALSALAKSATAGIAKDPRMVSILGNAHTPDAWLALVSSFPAQPQPSQQQRALMKQAAMSGQSGRYPPSPMQQQASILQKQAATRPEDRPTKCVPFPLRTWEIIPDAAVTMGENDTSLSLGLFAARKC